MKHQSIKDVLKIETAIISGVMAAALLAPSAAHAADRRSEVRPYIEVSQVVFADLKNGGDVLTYSTVAAGFDASITNRRAEAQVNVRYERRIGYSNQVNSGGTLSGLARGNVHLVRNKLSIEAGALATQTRVDIRGQSPTNLVGNFDNVTQVYSIYAGPTFQNRVGALDVTAAYRAGYTKVTSSNSGTLAPGQPRLNSFDDSVSHSAQASVGMRPGDLPVGWTASVGYEREDAGALDGRLENKHAKLDIVVPLGPTIAAVGSVGYEDIKISERDAVRDATGAPVVGTDGRLVTNGASPRLTSYDQSGIFWDAGVSWRPSRRTSLEARVGRRYGSTTFSGNLSYQAGRSTVLGITAYDTVSGFGSQLNNSIAGLPTQFSSTRNPLNGSLNNCAFSQSGGGCFNGALQSVGSSFFRARGVSAQASTSASGWRTGLGIGYQNRRFIAAGNGALALANGLVDQSYFVNLSTSKAIDSRSSFGANVYGNYLISGVAGAPDVLAVGATASYDRSIFDGLTGTAAVGLDSFRRQGLDSQLSASALVGLRYDFGVKKTKRSNKKKRGK